MKIIAVMLYFGRGFLLWMSGLAFLVFGGALGSFLSHDNPFVVFAGVLIGWKMSHVTDKWITTWVRPNFDDFK